MLTTFTKKPLALSFPTKSQNAEISDHEKLRAWMDAFDVIGAGALSVGCSYKITGHNRTFLSITNKPSITNLRGKDLLELLKEIFGVDAANLITTITTRGKHISQQSEINIRNHNTEKIYSVTISSENCGNKLQDNLVIIFQDITTFAEKLALLEHKASHDPLTGIPNRWMMDEIINNAVANALRTNYQLQVIYLDLDNFKGINDAYGHMVGDQVLKAVATKIKGCLRQGDSVARVGGDEFVIVLHRCRGSSEMVLARIEIALAPGIFIGDQHISVEFSFGVSSFPEDGYTSQNLLEIADQRMFSHKKFSKGGIKNQ